MATVVHLVRADADTLAASTIEGQVDAGDRVTLILLEGAPDLPHPAPVEVHRVPEELGYGELLDLVFAADQVIAW
jgi:hypothetical protein